MTFNAKAIIKKRAEREGFYGNLHEQLNLHRTWNVFYKLLRDNDVNSMTKLDDFLSKNHFFRNQHLAYR